MKNKNQIIASLFISVIFTFFGCRDDESKFRVSYYSSEIKANTKLSLIDSLVLKDISGFKLGILKYFLFTDSVIYISDKTNNCLWLLDSNYKLIKKIGSDGRGPGEYLVNPQPILTESGLYCMGNGNRKVDFYDSNLNLIESKKFPSNLIVQPFKWIKSGDDFLTCGMIKDELKLIISQQNSILVLDNNLKLKKGIFKWDKLYEKRNAPTVYNSMVRLCVGEQNSIYAVQSALPHKIFHYNSKYEILKKFGVKPKYSKESPEMKVEDVMKSIEATAKYVAKITRIKSLNYDFQNKCLILNYVNHTEEASYLSSSLLSDNYLQIFNEEYDCILDIKVPGPILDCKDGVYYILKSDEPNNTIIYKYKLLPYEKK